MKRPFDFVPAACVAALFVLNASAETGTADSNAKTCFSTTQKIAVTVPGTVLETAACDRALKAGPHTQAHKASVLFNRALIENANGDHFSAMQSLGQAVSMDGDLVAAKLTLAQLAHRLGDYATAVSGYAELLGEYPNTRLVRDNRDLLERNLQRARQSLLVVAQR